ncbi:hypothetical protein [Trueperella bialowiezensis]|uniref:Uncharacterized protein n=1 Tax=Trueperella bialowiezensis TaxID=312285 RepID=A0A3S4VTJ8_9ACTO|nr:hypothetical protein [Trueperella bialowiezensis]VEI13401.1 Uncharacterised protein [Trueperella bialowiezensis]
MTDDVHQDGSHTPDKPRRKAGRIALAVLAALAIVAAGIALGIYALRGPALQADPPLDPATPATSGTGGGGGGTGGATGGGTGGTTPTTPPTTSDDVKLEGTTFTLVNKNDSGLISGNVEITADSQSIHDADSLNDEHGYIVIYASDKRFLAIEATVTNVGTENISSTTAPGAFIRFDDGEYGRAETPAIDGDQYAQLILPPGKSAKLLFVFRLEEGQTAQAFGLAAQGAWYDTAVWLDLANVPKAAPKGEPTTTPSPEPEPSYVE